MKTIKILEQAGTFAENKDIARDLRIFEIIPTLEKNEDIVLDFKGVDTVTQSFIHALISDAIRKFGSGALDRISFRSCNNDVKTIIKIVCDYMQES